MNILLSNNDILDLINYINQYLDFCNSNDGRYASDYVINELENFLEELESKDDETINSLIDPLYKFCFYYMNSGEPVLYKCRVRIMSILEDAINIQNGIRPYSKERGYASKNTDRQICIDAAYELQDKYFKQTGRMQAEGNSPVSFSFMDHSPIDDTIADEAADIAKKYNIQYKIKNNRVIFYVPKADRKYQPEPYVNLPEENGGTKFCGPYTDGNYSFSTVKDHYGMMPSMKFNKPTLNCSTMRVLGTLYNDDKTAKEISAAIGSDSKGLLTTMRKAKLVDYNKDRRVWTITDGGMDYYDYVTDALSDK